MNKNFLIIEKKFDALLMREKILTCLAIFVAIYAGWHTVLYDYVLATDAEISKKSEDIRQKINLLEGKMDSVSQVLERDPTSLLSEQANNLKKENETLSKTMIEQTKKMVSPKDMTKILSNIIQKASTINIAGLTIGTIESMGTKALFEPKTIEENGQKKSFQVFQHSIKVEMVGGYFETLKFLKSMESICPDVVWDELSYEVKQYPYADVVVILHTLSLEEGWIGV